MARNVSIVKQWEREIIRIVKTEVPKIIVERKMRPLAKVAWSMLIVNTARHTGRLQHFYTPYVVRGNTSNAGARVPGEVLGPGRIQEPDYYSPGNPSAGHVEASRIQYMHQLYTITSGIPYAEHVEKGTHESGKRANYRKPHMMQRTAEFVARNAKGIMR